MGRDVYLFFFSSRRRHTRLVSDWSSDVCSSDLDPIFKTLAPGLGAIARTKRAAGADPRAELGYIHAGPAGAGHFVKMVHNGIEYRSEERRVGKECRSRGATER